MAAADWSATFRCLDSLNVIADEQVVALLPALAEAARAEHSTADRFVSPRPGILEETAARRHQFVFGRRGVGKSTLLRKIQSLGPEGSGDVIYVDIETLRGRPYPDVLIELLIEILAALEARLKAKGGRVDTSRSRRRIRRRLRRLTTTMRRLLNEPQSAQRYIRELQESERATGLGGGFDGRLKHVLRIEVLARLLARTRREETREMRAEESKMDGLLGAVILIRAALADAQKHLTEGATLVVLDDFYHVPYDDQPDVLAYLHQVVKNLGIYLKIGGVRHRLQPFVEGDPPRGLQLGQDAGGVSLDIGLERFNTAQTFLEAVLAGICAPLGIEVERLISDGGRTRLVLGSGGVARDYLYLVQNALRGATERESNPSRPHNRITAEDVNEAAANLVQQKQDDLALDVGEGADALRERLSDIVKFCLDVNGTNVFLVEGPRLQEEEWGKEIQGLADLRLLHSFGSLSVQTGNYRGRRFIGFTLDLSNYTGTRSERIRQIEFWTTEGKMGARRAQLIFEPGASERTPVKRAASVAEGEALFDTDLGDEELPGEWSQTTIDDLLPT